MEKFKKNDGFLHLSLRDNGNVFGQIIRENSLERLVLEGKIDGSRSRVRQRKNLDDLVSAVECLRKKEHFHLAQEREIFKCVVVSVNGHGTTRRRYK